jgi:Lactoylglutathione lyase and related lyases
MAKMIASGIDHVGIPCRDIDKTVEFYNSLGFETALRTVNPNSGEKVAFLRLGNLVVETYQIASPTGVSGAIDHLALAVDDIEKTFASVTKLGYGITTNGIESLPFWTNGVRFFKIEGPDGESIEFSQTL